MPQSRSYTRRRSGAQALRAADRPALPVGGSIGVSAVSPATNWGPEDRVRQLSGRGAFRHYQDMLRSHGLASTLIEMLVLPLRALGRDFSVEPSGESPADAQAAEMVESGLRGLARPWDRILQNCFLSIPLGVSVAEITWEERDGLVMPKDLAPRPAESIDKWVWPDETPYPGIEQSGYDHSGAHHTGLVIPPEKLLVFTAYAPGDDPWGLPLLRRMWRCYFGNDHLLKQALIMAEKMAQRIPIGKEPYGASDDDRTKVKKALGDIRSGESSALIQPYGWEFADIMGDVPAGNFMRSMLDYTDQDMARVAFAAFILLGTTATGARSVGDTLMSLYAAALDGYAAFAWDVFNRTLVPGWCDLNFPGLTAYPKLTCGAAAELVMLPEIMNATAQLVGAKAITPELGAENKARRWLGMPELEEQPLLPTSTSPAPPASPPGAPRSPSEHSPADEEASAAALLAADPSSLQPTDRECRFGLPAVRQTLDRASEMLGGEMRSLIRDILAAVTDDLRHPVVAAVQGDAHDRAALVSYLSGMAFPQSHSYQALLVQQLKQVIEAGASACAEQTGEPPSAAAVAQLLADADARAGMLARADLARLLFEVQTSVLRDVDGGLTADAVLRNLETAVNERATMNFADTLQAVSDSAIRSFARSLSDS